MELELPCDASAAFLLLAIFVGHGVSERKELKQRQATVRGHLVRLGLFTESEINNLSKRLVIAPPDDDYDWTWDDELGWCYGGDYPCYSLRNGEHAGGSEGAFPFEEWQRIMEYL